MKNTDFYAVDLVFTLQVLTYEMKHELHDFFLLYSAEILKAKINTIFAKMSVA